MTYQVAQLLFICSRDTMCLDLFLLVHFIMIPKMFVSIITHSFNVLSLAQKWTHNPKKQFLLKYFWTSAFFFTVPGMEVEPAVWFQAYTVAVQQ